MVCIEIKKLNISIEVKRKIEMICRFNNLKYEFINGNIKNIKRTNLAYVEPHQVIINDETYLFFDELKFIYLNTFDNKIPISDLDKYLRLKE